MKGMGWNKKRYFKGLKKILRRKTLLRKCQFYRNRQKEAERKTIFEPRKVYFLDFTLVQINNNNNNIIGQSWIRS